LHNVLVRIHRNIRNFPNLSETFWNTVDVHHYRGGAAPGAWNELWWATIKQKANQLDVQGGNYYGIRMILESLGLGSVANQTPFLISTEYSAGSVFPDEIDVDPSNDGQQRALWYAEELDSILTGGFSFALHYTLADYNDGGSWSKYGLWRCKSGVNMSTCETNPLDSQYWEPVPGAWQTYLDWQRNNRVFQLPGDLDGDCDVDATDVMRVAVVWNTYAGEALYKPEYDFDNDGDIDVTDVMYIASKWNTQCP
jgi:hypothetical protein